MNLNPEIEQRIYDAADQLYAAEGRARLPTVDAVRKLARTNMNDASVAMKVWRTNHAKTPISLVPEIPEPVRRAFETALTALWAAVQSHASCALNSAQSGWEVERADAETERQNLAAAFDEQAKELEEAHRQNAAIEGANAALALSAANAQTLLAARDAECRTLHISEAGHRTMASELRDHIADLRREADQSFAHTQRIQRDLDEARQNATAALAQWEQELAATTSDRDQLASQETEARETVNALRGQIEAMTKQNADLMAMLKPANQTKPNGTSKAFET